ncbi:hypothetical protein [Pseudarthrobacter sp. MM222]|uniref:hypothetical protein n=1 Tax=Pseudarthrobacter sp. MM222 TaxID=3018929 RepID=UPI00221ED238|nr:hypothetical protein [Pseudarthrobacter sp. MM222]CAI3796571.1 hypothetical protein NKCBBBOE_01602 [Pseudarthrobacter sp. MM222]
MDVRGPLRLLRAVLVTGAATALAAAGHVLAGGALPEPQILAIVAALLLGPVVWLARRQLSFPTLLGVLGTGQLILHEAFLVLSSPVPCPTSGEPMPHHGAGQVLDCSASVADALTVPTGSGADSPTMLAADLLALLATAWLLRGGEIALWQLLAWLRPLVHLPRSSWSVTLPSPLIGSTGKAPSCILQPPAP